MLHSLGIASSQNSAGSIQLIAGSVKTIPAASEMEIMVTPKGTVSGGTWIVEGDIVSRHGVMVAHAIVHVSNPSQP